ncbi:putative SOS response-associated peptidase YedK [Ensifer adhaerens]|uniref:SOS response-associated peptidase n=1 Tax=Ensifer adhaerens TaxID=106592 RepID=UPI00156A6674|nr:SOS response-associated peptidase [Ensifer adhaerens]NRP19503.1 putative SOS response-associated peptidase YedK [Ensifer adhaerens]
MCGRVYLKTNLEGLLRAFSFAKREGVEGLANQLPRFNGAPSQYYPIIIRDVIRDDGVMGPVFISARWGLIPSWVKERKPGQPAPINAKAETIATNGMFRGAYKSRRCLVPIDGFFEWKDIHGTGKNKQPYAIAMKSGEPFVLAGLWETWRDPATDEDTRTFCVVTCEPNAMMATIHDRMPVILRRQDYDRWLSPETEAHDLMMPFPAELMMMWKIGTKVGSPKNNEVDILDPVE